MIESTIYWVTSVAALLGVWLNIRKHVGCFYLWAFSNAVWVYADLTHGIYPQAALQAVYLALSFVGIWKWSDRRGRRDPTR